ncbi:DUF1203 domain-containing protein [Rhodobacter sp. NTK016B]|uniref:DUF1203 domain-containing protein n=1 Tax=Rhodobacter sp. NTK016B TaxID=2759676 RepID=UPI001A8CBFB9|nr:DUF1203 domain-containing protein [Rhodobacter sp. NTK016B]MBN8290902.1 DUF1203 domain-containing protein [Rhodobacter sp. NTK016B]
MTFQIHALPEADFAPLFALSDEDLAARHARRSVVTHSPGVPCRVSLEDAAIGETVLLINYTHQPASTPYRASHAIFVRAGVRQARPAPGAVPAVFHARLISVRRFDRDDMMIDAEAVEGRELGMVLTRCFWNPAVAYIHLHYAKPGCFAALVRRA